MKSIWRRRRGVRFTDAEAEQRAPVTSMTLESRGAPANGAMLLRYLIENAGPEPAEA